MKIINPANAELITEIEEDHAVSLDVKFEKLKTAHSIWRSTDIEFRISLIKRFSELLGEQTEKLALVLSSEVGKPLQQSRNEINGGRTRIKWLSENAGKYLADEIMTTGDGLEERISYEPLGVICNISAWNYPYLVGINVFVPALLAGNTVMYKPSEYASLTGLEIQRLLTEAGLPQDVFHVAIGGQTVGEQLLDINFDGYYFTGSYKTGKHIYERVASKMVPCQLELGGKDPLYVADDIENVQSVAAATADGAFYNNGQSCCAVERIYVHEKVYDAYVDAFIKEVKSFKIGDPKDEGVYIAALTRREQLTLLSEQVEEALAKGAIIAAGGKEIEQEGYYFEPTVLLNVSNDMQVMQEESFGPIIGIMKVKDDTEAVAMMQDTQYGLTASVYSSNKDRAEKILEKVDVGTGYWNCCDRVSAAVPWSGRKHSGFGSTLSYMGIRAFAKVKAWQMKG